MNHYFHPGWGWHLIFIHPDHYALSSARNGSLYPFTFFLAKNLFMARP